MTLPGYAPDLTAYKQWALIAGTEGIHTIYDRSTYDYPPLYAYILAPIGQIYAALSPEAIEGFAETRRYGDSAVFSILVKLPPVAFNVLIAFLLASLAWRFGMWTGRTTGRGWWPALLFLFLPPVLFDSAYWGQPDSVHSCSLLLALTLILVGKPELGWVSAALACLMKPLAVPFLPLLVLATLVRSGWTRLATGGLAALATALAVFLPFILSGRGALAYQRLFRDVGLMPYTSVNGHNVWWLIGPWQRADQPWMGPVTATTVGLVLFGIAYLAILFYVWRTERERTGRAWTIGRGSQPLATQHHWYLAGAAVAFSFFALSTHMHENHLYTVLPFLTLLAGLGSRWLLFALLVAAGAFVNMATHDLALADAFLGTAGGPSGWLHPDLGRPFSRVELGLAVGNSIFLVALFATMFLWMFRRPSAREQAGNG